MPHRKIRAISAFKNPELTSKRKKNRYWQFQNGFPLFSYPVVPLSLFTTSFLDPKPRVTAFHLNRESKPQDMGQTILFLVLFIGFLGPRGDAGVQILSKSKLEKCEKSSDSDNLNCTKKIVLNLAVPSGTVNLLPLLTVI